MITVRIGKGQKVQSYDSRTTLSAASREIRLNRSDGPTVRRMTTGLKVAWWVLLLACLAVIEFAANRFYVHAWVFGGVLAAVALVLTLGLRLTCDTAMGVRTES